MGAFSLRVSGLYCCLGFSEQVRSQQGGVHSGLGSSAQLGKLHQIPSSYRVGREVGQSAKKTPTSHIKVYLRLSQRNEPPEASPKCSLGGGEPWARQPLGPLSHRGFESPSIPSGLATVTIPVALLSTLKTCFL